MNRADRRALARDIQKQIAAGGVDLAAPAQQGAAQPATLFLAWMYNENGARPTGAWVQSLLACAARSAALGFQVRPRSCETGPQLCKARNLLVRSFLEQTEDDYLLFSDTDIAFAPEDVKALLEADAPIAGALYFTAATGMEPWPTALEWEVVEAESTEEAEDNAAIPEPSLVPITLPEPPEDVLAAHEGLNQWVESALQPRRVDAVGAGLMLIRRDVVASVAETYPRPFEYWESRGEDATFCLRAAELGFETVLVPKARVGHVKAQVL